MRDNGEKAGHLVNWLTVWGLIIACIAFNVYTSNQQQKKLYHAQ
ncbi:hypothetical protein [Spirosoma agri]|nr:hypothetical protein [Spirosoma agri]